MRKIRTNLSERGAKIACKIADHPISLSHDAAQKPIILVYGRRCAKNTIMKKEVTSVCGAVYERTEEKLTFRDNDLFQCRCCDNTLESWSGSRLPVFRLIREPKTKETS